MLVVVGVAGRRHVTQNAGIGHEPDVHQVGAQIDFFIHFALDPGIGAPCLIGNTIRRFGLFLPVGKLVNVFAGLETKVTENVKIRLFIQHRNNKPA